MKTISRSVLAVLLLVSWRSGALAQVPRQIEPDQPAGHSSIIESIAVSSDGKFFVTQAFSLDALASEREGTAILWDASDWKALHTFRPAARIALSGDDKSLAITSLAVDGRVDIIVWDTANLQKLQKLHTIQVRPPKERFNAGFSIGSLALSGDGTMIVTGMGERRAILWETATGKSLRTFEVGRNVSEGTAVAISGDSRLVLVGLQFAPSILWDAQTGQKLRTLQETFYAKIAVLSADGKLALTAGNDRAPGPVPQGAALWNTADGKMLHSFNDVDRPMQATSAALSADGKIVAVGNGDGTVNLWRTSEGRKFATVQVFQNPGRNPTVRSLGLSGDGRLLVAGDGWGTVSAWDTTTGEKLHTFEPQ